MIKIENLNESDTGRWVQNIRTNEVGKIKSWNEAWIFVVYKCDENWKRFWDYTAEATGCEDLIFVGEEE